MEAVEWPGDRSRRTMVLLHEGLGSVGLWRDTPARLAAATGRRVVAYSRLGHGRSDPPPGPRTRAFFDTEADAVLPEVLTQLDAPEPILVGHSDGASIALVHAGRHPVAGVVLMAPHVFVETAVLPEISVTRARYTVGDLRTRMARHHDEPDTVFWPWCDLWLSPAFGDWTLNAEIAALRTPTLLVQGAADPYGSLEQLDRIEDGAPGPVSRRVVPGGHSPHHEHPETTVDAISRFVADLP